MRKWSSSIKWCAVCIIMGFMLISCGNGGGKGNGENSGPDINDRWKSEDGTMTMVINFNVEPTTIELDGKTMPVTIKEWITKDSVKIDVTEDEGTVSTWNLQKLWQDNGSDFWLVLTLPDAKRVKFAREVKP